MDNKEKTHERLVSEFAQAQEIIDIIFTVHGYYNMNLVDHLGMDRYLAMIRLVGEYRNLKGYSI